MGGFHRLLVVNSEMNLNDHHLTSHLTHSHAASLPDEEWRGESNAEDVKWSVLVCVGKGGRVCLYV